MKASVFLFAAAVLLAPAQPGTRAADAGELTEINRQAQVAHGKRNLGDSTPLYKKLLELDPPVEPTAAQRDLVLRFAPRLMNVRGEFFPLKDIVAILHPEKPIIGYHLFWEDDLGFPSDNDPCDHEVVWITYDPATRAVTALHAYWHGRIIAGSAAAIADANAHSGRAWVGVEWGFHGSVLFGARGTEPVVDEVLRSHWERIHNPPKDRPRDPLARGWPVSFPGDFAAFTAFAVAFDPRPMLRERRLAYVSPWANATINRWCLRYNFAAKTEWPWLATR